MDRLLKPRQVARAIGVSESSLKRWCDQGLLPTARTAGGHRRLPLDGVMEFLRRGGHPLVEPQALGLPPATGQGTRVIGRAADQMVDALLAGDEDLARQIVFDLYLANHRISSICDQVIARAFHTIGEKWGCGEAEVYQERRGCEISTRVLHELRLSVKQPPADAPLALGGTPEGDFYTLPTRMVELALRESGIAAVSLGSSLPFATLKAAVRDRTPRLFWLSASHLADGEKFIAGYREFFDSVSEQTAVIVGGRALVEAIRQQIKYAAFCDTLAHLETFVEAWKKAAGA